MCLVITTTPHILCSSHNKPCFVSEQCCVVLGMSVCLESSSPLGAYWVLTEACSNSFPVSPCLLFFVGFHDTPHCLGYEYPLPHHHRSSAWSSRKGSDSRTPWYSWVLGGKEVFNQWLVSWWMNKQERDPSLYIPLYKDKIYEADLIREGTSAENSLDIFGCFCSKNLIIANTWKTFKGWFLANWWLRYIVSCPSCIYPFRRKQHNTVNWAL